MILAPVASGFVPFFLDHWVDDVIPVDPTWVGRPVAFDLSADGRVVSAQPAGDFPEAVFCDLQMTDDIPFLRSKMSVGHGGILSGVKVARTSNTTRNPIMSCFLARLAGGALTS